MGYTLWHYVLKPRQRRKLALAMEVHVYLEKTAGWLVEVALDMGNSTRLLPPSKA